MTHAFAASLFPTRPQGPHSKEQNNNEVKIKTPWKSFFPTKAKCGVIIRLMWIDSITEFTELTHTGMGQLNSTTHTGWYINEDKYEITNELRKWWLF